MTPYKILYIEDYEPAAITLDFILKDIGHTPTGALTGAEALELAAGNHYDLIMIDVKLPDMPGHVVAEKIRAYPDINLTKPSSSVIPPILTIWTMRTQMFLTSQRTRILNLTPSAATFSAGPSPYKKAAHNRTALFQSYLFTQP